MGTRWTNDDMEKIQRLKDSGQTWEQIAQQFGKTPNALQQAWWKHNKYTKHKKVKVVKADKPDSITFEIPEPTSTGHIAIILIQPNQLKQAMEDLWR